MAQADAAIHGEHEPTDDGSEPQKAPHVGVLGIGLHVLRHPDCHLSSVQGEEPRWSLPYRRLRHPVTSVSTFVLLMSSMSMVLAYSWLVRGNLKAFRIWLAATAIMGATFLAFQTFEFRDFAVHGLTPRTNLFGSSFFTLTGFHGAHVTIGVIWLLSILFTRSGRAA